MQTQYTEYDQSPSIQYNFPKLGKRKTVVRLMNVEIHFWVDRNIVPNHNSTEGFC